MQDSSKPAEWRLIMPGGCIEAGITLAAGPCMPFVAPFAARTASLAKLSDTEFQQAVALGPTPSNQCCTDAGAFVREVSTLTLTRAKPYR